jgi:hypothetical protein
MHGNPGMIRRGPGIAGGSRVFSADPAGRGHWSRNSQWRRGDWNGQGDWRHGNRTAWRRHDEGRDHEHHRHDRFSFGFFPYWYPGWGYYDYGYPYYAYDYPDYYYPDNGYYYPDNGYYSDQNGSANVPALVQQSLARRGYYAGGVDGVIGPETRSAIREFQRDNGLPVTGRIDSQLMQALKLG